MIFFAWVGGIAFMLLFLVVLLVGLSFSVVVCLVADCVIMHCCVVLSLCCWL